ncbi:MAG: methyltransferase [Alphaproteobacteria bacterium]|nr:methyltransferase [Alphaproteobacteria bacterium]|tara:strand:- start:81 stop:1163 length:1083 start_codon:yes stop_codon:yes gene_type:complete
MSPLEYVIKTEIYQQGSITVERFMSLVLSHPKYGYYSSRDSIGGEGDFITAPEISQMFGEMLGLWALVTWQQTNGDKNLSLTEIGPGKGTLMKDILRAVKMVTDIDNKIQINLVEISQKLKLLQQAKLINYKPKWYPSISKLPHDQTIFIANEFFDALPILQVVGNNYKWYERRISLREKEPFELFFTLGPPIQIDSLPSNILNLKVTDGEIFEYSPSREITILSLAKRVENKGGAILIVDYGHNKTSIGETLQAVKNHQSHSVLENPGIADITAHVDFESLKRAVSDTNTNFFGPITQGEFLRRIGIETRAAKLLKNANSSSALKIESALKRLIDPNGMGQMFKVVAITKRGSPVPPGF